MEGEIKIMSKELLTNALTKSIKQAGRIQEDVSKLISNEFLWGMIIGMLSMNILWLLVMLLYVVMN